MNKRAENKILVFCVWSGPVFLGLSALGLIVLARFVPLPSPTNNAAYFETFYMQNVLGVRLGMLAMMAGAACTMPFAAAMLHYVGRIEGKFGPLSALLLMGSIANALLLFYPCLWWEVVVFRPDRDPQLIYLLSDFCWLQWVGGLALFLPMPLSIAVASFVDESKQPVFPRWFGCFTLFATLSFLPDQAIFFFHSGPFSWNGLFAIYLPLVVYGMWVILMVALLHNAVRRDAALLGDLVPGSGPRSDRLSPAE